MSKSVLITGAGRGIGRAASLRLARDGWHVYAGVRKLEDGEALASELGGGASGAIEPLVLDVTDEAAIAAAAEKLPEKLDAVVNNAGIAVDGPVETLTTEKLQEQYAVNVYGPVAVVRAVMPKIRAAGGRIVFVSSVSGRISTPWTGAYNSSKFAVEGLADALRIELRPWKIPVSLIEPANTDTDMWGGAEAMFDETVAELSDEDRALYNGHLKGVRRTLKMMQKTASPVDGVAKAIEHAVSAGRPRARYVVGVPAKAQVAGSAITPRPVMDFVLAKAMGIPSKAKS
jgi:NAD(P)-dependent dehydrogenase (short-subunit alcohol dehydrogenase family)